MTKISAFVRRNYATLMLCIIILCMFIILGYSILASQDVDKLTSKQDIQLAKIEELGEQNKELTKQNTKLAEDNIFLADRNIFYSKCIAKMFVIYTQNLKPISLDSLSQCDFTVKDDGSFTEDFSPTLNQGRQSPPPNSSDYSVPSKPDDPKPQESTQPQTREVCTLDLLGIKLNCRQEPV